ncbi:hypothetical protein LCGC14_1163720 [marine sediment metagenome]|uniref:Uncharacterized protein n=2 Tax=root TaxID=1 RepID=A0A831QTR7_9FLAO|nr:hypothetical protein [Pricia antarctica]
MDTSFVLVCLIVTGGVFIPFILFSYAGQGRTRKVDSQIKLVATQYNLNISKSEKWGNSYLGLDTDQRKLLYLDFGASENPNQLIDIDAIKGCQIVEKRKILKAHENKEALLESLDLEVLQKDGTSLVLTFYDIDENRKEDFELQRIEKWRDILMNHISTISIENRMAVNVPKIRVA